MKFDKDNEIPSVFFFCMNNGLGASYSQNKAKPVIKYVYDNGFDVGVHGIDFEHEDIIKKEHEDFKMISGIDVFGIRNHYVRFNDETFDKMTNAGYLFDSTWFNKNELDIRAPYKVGNMWEFPLHIMDGYICKAGELYKGIEYTIAAIKLAETKNMPYCTILFHDYQFENKRNSDMKKWYIETIKYLQENNYEFISYRNAIKELEEK